MRAIATTTQQNPGAIGIAHGAEGTLDNAVFIEFIGLLQVRALALFETCSCPSDGRRLWQAEAAVNGFDWSNLIALHLNIVDLLRGSSS
jgi:hypothetical protein